MKKILVFIVIISLIFVVSCKKTGTKKELLALTGDTISKEALWNRIKTEEPYKKYSNWPDHKGMFEGQSPHGMYHIVYINDTISKAFPIKNRIIPQGGIIVKENYNQDKELVMLTVMAKMEDDFDPDNNNWYWAKYDLMDDNKSAAGKLQKCADCHSPVKDNDYIFLSNLGNDITGNDITTD